MIDISPACRRVSDVLAGITDDQLAGVTPCDDFTIADLLGQVNASAVRLGALARREAAEEPGDSSRELIGRYVRALATAWQEPSVWRGTTDVGIELTNEVWGRIAFTEMVVHGWDLARPPVSRSSCPNPHCKPSGST